MTWPFRFYLERESVTERDSRRAGGDDTYGRKAWTGEPEFTYASTILTDEIRLHIAYEYRTSGIKHVSLDEDEIRTRGANQSIVPEIAP